MNHTEASAWIQRLDDTAIHRKVSFADGRSMQWRCFGDGPPLLLIHGGHGTWLHWVRNIETLAQRHQLWIPDLPGFGESDDPQPAQDFHAIVADMLQALDALFGAVVPIDIAAFSFGTRVATHLASRRPVRKLALLGVAGHGGERRVYPAMVNWRKAHSDAERRAMLRHNLTAFMLYDDANADVLAVAAYELACLHTRFRSRKLTSVNPLRTMLELINVPLLFIWGAEDVTSVDPVGVAHDLCDHRAATRWQVLPHAGHWVQFEQADQVNALLLDWFDQ